MVNRRVNAREPERTSGFRYTPPDPKKMKERSERTGQQFDSYFKPGVDTWTPHAGDNVVRILPPTWEGHDHFGYEIWVHGYVGSDRSSYLCPKKMLNKKCPICEAAKEAKAAGEDDEAKSIGAKQRYLYWIIDRDGDTDDPAIWSVSWSMDRDIAALCTNKRTGALLTLDHPTKGYDLMFKRQGQGLKTRYVGVQIDREPSAIVDSAKARDGILEFLMENPLDGVLKFFDAKHLEGIIEGKAEAKDEELDETGDENETEDDPPPRRSARKPAAAEEEDDPPPRGRRRPVAEPEDEITEETEDDDPPPRRGRRPVAEPEEEIDDPPPRRSARRPRDEDAPFEEEDDPPPPRRVARKPVAEEAEDDPPPPPRRGRRAEPEPEDDGETDVDPEDAEDDPPPRVARVKRVQSRR